jgi:hypothetical protein
MEVIFEVLAQTKLCTREVAPYIRGGTCRSKQTPPVHYFALNRYSDDATRNDVIHAAGKPFLGKVFVIVDSSNSSVTFQFARLIKEKRLGTLVGEPTGGNLRGINGGAFFFLRLPKSEIEMDLPLTARPDAGLDPDIFVAPSVEDLVAKRDPVLEKTADLTKNTLPPDPR